MEPNEGGQTAKEQTPQTQKPAGFVFSFWTLLFFLGVLVYAAWQGFEALAILISLILAAAAFAKLWSMLSLRAVRYRRIIRPERVFPGEAVTLTFEIENRKPIPLPWVQVEEEIPAEIAGDELATEPGNRPDYPLLRFSAALRWYSRVRLKKQVICRKRGYYELGTPTLTSGDIFGFYPKSETFPSEGRLIVYPRIFDLDGLMIESGNPLGNIRSEKRIFSDPTRMMGVRDYQAGDDLRHIHWKASARRRQIQVKVFEPTTSLKIAVFLAVDSFMNDGSVNEEDFELAVSAAASVARHFNDLGSPVGLFVNTRLADSGHAASLPPGAGGDRLVEILEALAKTTTQPSDPFQSFFRNERSRLPWGASLILVLSANGAEHFMGPLIDLKRSGISCFAIPVGEGDGSFGDFEIPYYRLESAHDGEAHGSG